jgi:hypothetical protein
LTNPFLLSRTLACRALEDILALIDPAVICPVKGLIV